MNDVQQSIVGGESDTCLPRLFIRAGVLVAGHLVEKGLTCLLKADSVRLGVPGGFIAVPDKGLPIQGREHVHIAIVYTIATLGKMETHMMTMAKKPIGVGENLVEEFMEPLGLSQTRLAEVTGLPRKHINELCQDRRAVTADTALILARVFGNSPDFWLNTQRRNDLWEALHTPKRLHRIERAQPIIREQLQAAG
jgi:addiction module HigA family antidote